MRNAADQSRWMRVSKRHLIAALVAALLGASTAFAWADFSNAGRTATQSYTAGTFLPFASTTPGKYTVAVPPGITSVRFTTCGGGGGGGASATATGGAGGGGDCLTGDIATPVAGITLTVVVAGGGGGGSVGAAGAGGAGGDGTAGGGGAGGTGGDGTGVGAGGGGGGSSVIYLASAPSTPVVIAPGGAGGGGAGIGGNGGAGGAAGNGPANCNPCSGTGEAASAGGAGTDGTMKFNGHHGSGGGQGTTAATGAGGVLGASGQGFSGGTGAANGGNGTNGNGGGNGSGAFGGNSTEDGGGGGGAGGGWFGGGGGGGGGASTDVGGGGGAGGAGGASSYYGGATVNSFTYAVTSVSSTLGSTNVGAGNNGSVALRAEGTRLVFTTQPGGGSGSIAWSQQPVVAIEDPEGNIVTTASANITLTLNQNGNTGVLSGCTAPVATISGVATFSGCAVNKKSGVNGYTLSAAGGGFAPTTSASFSITVGPAFQLGFTTQPGGTITGGTAFGTQPAVAIQDAGGNTVTTDTSAITLEALNTTTKTNAAVTCTTNPLAAIAGVATFSGCALNDAATYTLLAFDQTDQNLIQGISSPLTVGVGPATKLAFDIQPSGSVGVSNNFPTQPEVSVEDAGGNLVSAGTQPTIQLTLTSGSGTLTCKTNPITASGGVATFSKCNIDTLGGGDVITATTTAGPSYASAASNPFSISAAATQLVFTTSPTGQSTGALSPQPVASVEDASGRVVTTATGTAVSLAINTGTGTLFCSDGSDTQSSSPSINTSYGVASFTGCGINATGAFTLKATSSGLTTAATSGFNVTALSSPTITFPNSSHMQALSTSSADTGFAVFGTGFAQGAVSTVSGGTFPVTVNSATQINSGVVVLNVTTGTAGTDDNLTVTNPDAKNPATQNASVDPPSAAITSPSDSSAYDAGTWSGHITGTASDGTNGVADVEVTVEDGSGTCWTGSGNDFSAACPNWVPVTSGTTTWSLDFPSSNFAADGTFAVTAMAIDAGGNTGTGDTVTFVYGTPPTVSLAFPSDGATYDATGWSNGGATACGTSDTICGQATDVGGGIASGSSISITITQASTGDTWNGTTFAPGNNAVDATSYDTTSGAWTYAFPSSDFAIPDTYSVSVIATDASGFTSTQATSSFSFSG